MNRIGCQKPTCCYPSCDCSVPLPKDDIAPPLVAWLKAWWTRGEAWRDGQRAQLGPDVAHLMRGVADMIENHNDAIIGLLRGVESLLHRCLRHGLLRTEIEVMLHDVGGVLKNTAPQEMQGSSQDGSNAPAVAAPSPPGGLDDVLAEYDSIVNGRLDPRDAEADFVMRGSDWRVIREALSSLTKQVADMTAARALEENATRVQLQNKSPSSSAMATVGGEWSEQTIYAHVQRAEHYLAVEQAKISPDNALIAMLCDSVRLTRELTRMASSPVFSTAAPSDVGSILAEVERAIAKFPTWPTDPLHALAVLGEEFGELTKEALQLVYEPHKTSAEEVSKEALQTAAMALRFYRSLDRYEYRPGVQHKQQTASGQSGISSWERDRLEEWRGRRTLSEKQEAILREIEKKAFPDEHDD